MDFVVKQFQHLFARRAYFRAHLCIHELPPGYESSKIIRALHSQSRKFLESIRALPAPTNITDARSFFGMINQVSNFFAMSPIMAPFRHLLKPNTPFIWDSALQDRFERAKEVIIEKVTEGIKHFEPDRPTCLATDW